MKDNLKSLDLKTANDYINRRSLEREDLENIKNLVYDFKHNFSGLFSLIVYKQISRISRMLNKIEELEIKLYEMQLIDDNDLEGMERFQKILNLNVTLMLDQLTSIASNPNLKVFFDNNGLFVEKLTQKLYRDEGDLNPSLEISSSDSLSKESRSKINNVLNKLLLSI